MLLGMIRLGLCLLLFAAPAGMAESNAVERVRIEVHLDDGSYVMGTIAQQESLRFRTSYAKLELRLSQVLSIKTAPPGQNGTLFLRNGDKLTGNPDVLELDMETAFGRISVGMDRVASVLFRQSQPLPPELWRGLMLYYSFDEENPAVAKDRSSEGNHGRVVRAGWTARGQVGGAATFSGKGQFIRVPNHNTINFSRAHDFSVLAWIYADPKQVDVKNLDADIVEKWSGGGGYPYTIRLQHQKDGTGGVVGVGRWNGKDGGGISAVKGTVGRFHHVAFIRRGRTLELYIDGEPDGTSKDLSHGRTHNDSPLFLGCRGGRENFFKGMMDELMIYDRALSAGDIKRIYAIQR